MGPLADPAGFPGLGRQNSRPCYSKYVYKSTPVFSALFMP